MIFNIGTYTYNNNSGMSKNSKTINLIKIVYLGNSYIFKKLNRSHYVLVFSL